MTDLFMWLFIVLTLIHPIADYMIPLNKRIPWHYILVLNPLHFLWDETFGKKHSQFTIHFRQVKQYQIYYSLTSQEADVSFQRFEKPYDFDIIEQPFWFWLGLDQLVHVILNLIFVYSLEVLI